MPAMSHPKPYGAPYLRLAEPKPPPKPPRYRRAASRRWWSEIVAEYDP